eukprot:5643733-Alexandrium_andersonii.AAC.1
MRTEACADPFVDVCLGAIGEGRCHPTEVVTLTRALVASGRGDTNVQQLSRLGGDSLKNVERDLHRRFRGAYNHGVAVYDVPITIK